MRKLLILLFTLISIVWAEVKIEMSVRVEEMPETLFDFYNWDRNCVDFGCFGEDSFGKERIVCSTELDSNILYGWPYEGVTVEFYVLTGAIRSWREVFENQLNRYRKCARGTADDSTYNTVIAEIESALVPAINECLQKGNCIHKALIYDMGGMGRLRDFITPGPNYEFIGFALDTVNARNAAISSIAPAKYKLESIRVQNHQLSVSPKLLGREFVLFDVNGHELRRGTLQNNMRVPAYPTVIKIQGFGTKLLNSR